MGASWLLTVHALCLAMLSHGVKDSAGEQVGVSSMKKAAGFYYINEDRREVMKTTPGICKANTYHRKIHYLSLCCTASNTNSKNWIVSNMKGNRPMLYALGVGTFPGAYVDAAEVAKMVGADANSKGDYAIAAQVAEKIAASRGLNDEDKMPPKFAGPPPEPKHEDRTHPGSGGPIYYMGCYHSVGPDGPDLKWGPKKYGYTSIQMCEKACPEYVFFGLSKGFCSCDNSFQSPKKEYPKVHDTECNMSKFGKGFGGDNRNAIYTARKEGKRLPCPKIRRRRTLSLKFNYLTTKGPEDFKGADTGNDYEGSYYSEVGQPDKSRPGKGIWTPDQCKSMCQQDKVCTTVLWKCNANMTTVLRETVCECKLYRDLGKKIACNKDLPISGKYKSKPCQRFEHINRTPKSVPPAHPNPPPPPPIPPLPKHCGGEQDAGVTNAAKDAAAKAATLSVEAAKEKKEQPKPFKAGQFKGDKEIVKYNHATFNAEDGIAGCQVGTAYGRRVLEISLNQFGKTKLAKLNFTFMRMTVCKGSVCEVKKEVLDCVFNIKDFDPGDLNKPPLIRPQEACTDDALMAATSSI